MNVIDMNISTPYTTSDTVAAMPTTLKLHCCDCYFIGNYVLLMKS